MATKIKSYTFYVAITPYKVEGVEDEYNELSVVANYNQYTHVFYVSLHAGWRSSFGHGCTIMGDRNPLTASTLVCVKESPKNSQKTINEMGANLEQAKDAIAWLFDHREWAKLYLAVGNIARNGYTEYYRKQMEELINNNKPNKEDENMRLNINSNSETKNVQTAAQVNNNSNDAVMHEVDVIGLMNGLKKNGEAKLSDYATPVVPDAAPVEDAHAEEIESVSVGEVTVDSIMPVMQPVEGTEYAVESDGKEAKFESVAPNIGSEPAAPTKQEVAEAISKAANEGKDTTMPLGSHGTLVIGGVPKPKVTLKRKVQDSVPQTGKYQYVTYEVKKVNKTTKKEYTVTGSKIVGFELTDPIYLAGPAFCGAISTESVCDKTVGTLRFSHKWTPAVKDVCDLLNSGNATLEGCVAIINGAKVERSERIQERIAKRAERKAERSLSPNPIPEHSSPTRSLSPKGKGSAAGKPAASYSDQDVADMLRKVMAGGDVPENIKKLLAA